MQRKRSSGGKFTSGSKKASPSFKRTDKNEFRKGGSDSKSTGRYSDKKDDGFKPRKKYGDDTKDFSRGKDDFKPRRSFDKDKKFGDKDEYKPRKTYGDDKKDFSRGKDDFKPSRSFDKDKKFGDKSEYKPRKTYGDEKKDFSRGKDDFKPRRSFDKDKKFGDKDEYKPRKTYGDDKKDFSRGKDDFKPSRSFDKDKKFGDKDEYKPRKTYGDDKKDFSRGKDDFKPSRSFDKDKKFGDKTEYKPRKTYGDDKKDDFKPRKSYGAEKSDYAPRKTFPKKDYADGENKFVADSTEKKNKYMGRKPVFKKTEEVTDEEFSLEKFNEDKKRHSTEKKKYETLTKSRKTSFAKEREDDGTTRLNKYLSNAGICSRREADQLIESGVIRVNGKVVTELGTRILQGDKVSYGDQTVKSETLMYLLLNKPKDYITTVDDPDKRRTVMELIKGACKERVYPVGRLDRNTTGLLLFTNDGELTMKLTHPKNNIKKIYHVVTDQNVSKEDMEKLRNGIELEDGFIMPDDVEFVGEGHNKKDIGIEIHSGKNRVVRRMFEHLGYNVIKLDRVMFAGLTKKDLPRGKWRLLSKTEIGFLKKG
jgi:23S rRNA pseudouridine2605 synthase